MAGGWPPSTSSLDERPDAARRIRLGLEAVQEIVGKVWPYVLPGISLPEMVILRRVLTLGLIVVFTGVVASEILTVGYVFNLVV